MKKRIPLNVLETLEKFVELKGEQFEVIDPKEFLLKVVDKDNESNFYFNIENYKVENGLKLLVDWKPSNKESTANFRGWTESRRLDAYFDSWISLLKNYESVKTFYDDPILQSFSEEYYAEFEIIDENAESNPFKTKQILMLDEHLEHIENNIEKFQTENNKDQIASIKEDIAQLRNNLTTKSKKWIIRNLSIIWAKITKQGTPLLKEFLSESKKGNN